MGTSSLAIGFGQHKYCIWIIPRAPNHTWKTYYQVETATFDLLCAAFPTSVTRLALLPRPQGVPGSGGPCPNQPLGNDPSPPCTPPALERLVEVQTPGNKSQRMPDTRSRSWVGARRARTRPERGSGGAEGTAPVAGPGPASALT